MVTVKKLYYFIDLENGSRKISKREYIKKLKEYERIGWDFEEFSRNFINTELYVQYENCFRFYLNDSSIVIGYGQREIY